MRVETEFFFQFLCFWFPFLVFPGPHGEKIWKGFNSEVDFKYMGGDGATKKYQFWTISANFEFHLPIKGIWKHHFFHFIFFF